MATNNNLAGGFGAGGEMTREINALRVDAKR